MADYMEADSGPMAGPTCEKLVRMLSETKKLANSLDALFKTDDARWSRALRKGIKDAERKLKAA